MKIESKIKLSEGVWSESGSVFVRGHTYYEQEYVDSAGIIKYIQDVESAEELSSLLEEFNGFYSVVIDHDDKTMVASDRMRTGPVLYSTTDEQLLITDDCGWILSEIGKQNRSALSEVEYERCRLVTGSNTLYEGISQLQSGEVVVINKSTGEVSHHQHHVHTTSSEEYDGEDIEQKFETKLERAFDRLTRAAAGRQIVVPLSGGYDSRLIALMLKKSGYENVLTYSDKSSGSGDADLAEEVADNIGLPWTTVELTHSDWHSFYNSEKWCEYFERASYLGSLPQPTHVLTLEKLLDRGEISQDAIIVPGHSALDTMKATPPKLEGQTELNLGELTDQIISQHFKYNTHVQIPENQLSDRVSDSIQENTSNSPTSSVEAFERWRLKERRTKLIVNGNRAFDFVGLNWWIPLEDKELYEFWKMVPMEEKRHRSFYEDYIEELYREIGNVDKEESSQISDDNYKAIIADLIRDYPIWPFAKRMYGRWTKSKARHKYVKKFKLYDIYQKDARFGIISEEELKASYNGQNYIFYSILAEDTLDKFLFN